MIIASAAGALTGGFQSHFGSAGGGTGGTCNTMRATWKGFVARFEKLKKCSEVASLFWVNVNLSC